jgi:uncharacterized protein
MRAVAFAAPIALSALLTPAANSQANDAPATNCDAYAASDLDPQRKANGVPFDKINTVLAVPACESAVRKYPNTVRLIYQLGRSYAKKNDFKSAFVQYQKAADQGYVLAEYNLGVLYEKGWGVAKDDARAVTWYRKAAEQGMALAQSNLGNMYRNGQGVSQDYPEALRWLHKAADQGDAHALVVLGLMFAEGQGVRQDYIEAVKFYRKAAESGDARAQTNLGSMYGLGTGVPQDYAEAAKWFRLAADQGYASAQYLLGLLFEDGDGVPKNIAEAADWYRKAAAQGNDEARRKFVGLDADAKAGRAAKEAGNATLRKALAAGKTTPQAWEEAALAAGRAALDVELAAGRTQELARQVAQQATDQVRAQAPKVGAGEPGTITVEMSIAATPTNPPVIMGTTNLPDETILSVHLLGDPPACVPDCGLEYNAATVQNGRFTTTLKGPHPLISDAYTIDIAVAGSPQSQSVQSVIGKLGEHLRGPYVVMFGPHGEYVPVEFPRNTPPSDSEQIVGLMIHYTQKIYVAGDASSDAAFRTKAIADFRKWSVESCTSNIDAVNALVRSGAVTGRETLGAERQAKIDSCIASGETKLQAGLHSQEPNVQPTASEPPAPAYSGQSPVQTRVATCQAMRRNVGDWTPEKQEAYRRQGCWQRAEADNGAAYQIDLGLIQSFAAGATTAVYTDEGGTFNIMNLKRWYFTCEGHFSVMEDYGLGPTLYAPPRSVARHISEIVCAGAGVEPRRN